MYFLPVVDFDIAQSAWAKPYVKIHYWVLDWIFKFPNRNRLISTPRLNTLLCLHLVPIIPRFRSGSPCGDVIISHGPQTIPNLEVGFTLRCFQSLSFPDLATLRCPWQDSRHTRGQFTPVLSSLTRFARSRYEYTNYSNDTNGYEYNPLLPGV